MIKFMVDTNLSKFEQEVEVLEKVSDLQGFSKLVDKGLSNSSFTNQLDIEDMTRFLVMEKLETALIDVYDYSDSNFKKIDVLKLGIELFNLMEKLHDKDITHQNLKPDNIIFDKFFSKGDLAMGKNILKYEGLDLIQRKG